jgi:hypothetical protein
VPGASPMAATSKSPTSTMTPPSAAATPCAPTQRPLADARTRRFKVVVDDIERLSRDEIGPIQLTRQLGC